MQKRKIVLLMLVMVGSLVGCGRDKAPEVSSVSIGKDGVILHQIVREFEESYDMDELQKFASDRVAEYCTENGENSVALESVDKTDDKVVIQLQYASGSDYHDFNHREMFIGSVTEASEQGYQLENVAFISPDGKPMEVGYMEEQDKTQIVIIETKPMEELLVNVYGKVLYINQSATSDEDVSFAGKKGVRITHPHIEGGENESILSYIVFQ